MPDDLEIRSATAQDVPELLQLYTHLTSDPVYSNDKAALIFQDFQSIKGSNILIGWSDGIMVTSCVLVVVPNLSRGGRPYALIENVVTHADHRGRGHATAILNAASDLAWQQGCYKIMLMTGSRRKSTLDFYVSAGFEQSKTGFQKRRLPPRKD